MTYIIEILGILAGAGSMYMGLTKYGWWKGKTIGAGLMPTILGGMLILFCVLMLIAKVRRKEKAEKFDLRALYPIVAMLVALLCNYFFGMLIACAIVSFLWMFLFEKYSWKKSLLISVIIFACVYGIFRLWLNVPFPRGVLNIQL